MKAYDFNFQQWQQWCAEQGLPAFRAKQIFSWCAKGAQPQEMTNLPQSIIQSLARMGTGGVNISEVHRSSDGSEKYLYTCEDGHAVEGVLMQYQYGGSLCVSTQAGCRMGCRFCASGEQGLARNLTPGEMAGQLYAVTRLHQQRPFNHFVLMGCGEPLDNYENVVHFLKLVSDERGLNISLRNVSLSTCGLVERIDDLAQENLPITLCISLHAADDETRRKIMPIANRYAIADVIAATKRYEQKTSRRVVFEYILIHGVNDSPEDAKRLAALTAGMRKHINLIPFNGAKNGFTAPDAMTIAQFRATLEANHASVTVRRRIGADVEGACGQLRLKARDKR